MGALDSTLLAAVRASGSNKGRPYLVGHKTAAYTVTPQDCYGGVITNEGATGSVTLTLPAAAVGMSLHVQVLAAQAVVLDPASGEIINAFGGAADDTVANGTPAVGEYITLACVEAGEWLVSDFNGTWDDSA